MYFVSKNGGYSISMFVYQRVCLGGGFIIFLIFTPKIGEDFQVDECFSDGWFNHQPWPPKSFLDLTQVDGFAQHLVAKYLGGRFSRQQDGGNKNPIRLRSGEGILLILFFEVGGIVTVQIIDHLCLHAQYLVVDDFYRRLIIQPTDARIRLRHCQNT